MPTLISNVPTTPFQAIIGNYDGYAPQTKFAINDAVGTSFEDLWSVSTNLAYLSAADVLEVLSSSADDNGTGTTGALTIRVFGLDANFVEVEEDLTLNGLTVVEGSTSFLRVYRAMVMSAGTTGSNIGTITIRDKTGDTTQCSIPITANQSLMSQYTIPANKTAYFINGYVTCGKGDDATFRLMARVEGGVFQVKREGKAFQDELFHNFDGMFKIPEKTDIKIMVKSSAGGVSCSGGYDFILKDV